MRLSPVNEKEWQSEKDQWLLYDTSQNKPTIYLQ